MGMGYIDVGAIGRITSMEKSVIWNGIVNS